jgi:cytochrome c peroxidase
MNDKDMNNIYYILNRTPEQLESWWNTMDQEDQEYAMWIIKEYKKELARMETVYDEFLPEDDTSLAKEYLKKFQL